MGKAKCFLKLPLALAAATLVAGQAMAQNASNVVLYGVVDEFVTHIKVEGAGAVTRLDSSGLLASRWGMRGREDLGAGLAANFALEYGFNADNGSAADANRPFNRQSWAGMSGSWGEFRLGRQNTPQFFMNGKFDAFGGATQASGWNNVTGTAPRVDDAVGYFTPVLANVKAQVLYARGAIAGAPVAAESRANRNIHTAVEYEIPRLYVGLNHEIIDNQSLAFSQRRLGLGASYAVTSRWRIYAATGRETRSDGSLNQNLYAISAGWQLTPASNLAFGYFKLKDRLSGAGHGDADQTSVLYRYSLSKRTTIYSALSHLQQHGLRNNLSLGGAAVVAAGARPTTAVPGGSIDALQLGITHSF
ncbi:porin [Caenimonas terrae]|uniref:Porin n=1 Tax=Caenimonas terrae TaxID=696074 RepID=A0ABW0NIE6_9BURK